MSWKSSCSSESDDDRAVRDFLALWEVGTPPLDRFWAGLGRGRPATLLTALIKIELLKRFERGERPRAAEFLAQFPGLARDSDRAISIIYEEFCLLQENGEAPSSDEFCRLYEPWSDSLASQLVYHRELSQVAGLPSPCIAFPAAGDRFGPFRLRSEIGRGGAARVYLATDEGLGDRRVALKISASVGHEPSILAKLDHRGIVPILTVTESPETGLRGICMPFRPGRTLESLIRSIGRGMTPFHAESIWKVVDSGTELLAGETITDRPGWEGFPIKGTYHEAVAFIGLALARATAYLHGQGVHHRDIKPANILLAFREGPQLLDFNLAHASSSPEQARAALQGGTLPYMAPEQLQAFLNPSLWPLVRDRADIYSLGLVLKELATGLAPDIPDGRLPLARAIQALHDRRSGPTVPSRQLNPSIPPALESIINRCTAFEPTDRYEDAEELASDLSLFLERKPLRGAANTSLMERASNLIHRNLIATLMLCTLAGASAFVRFFIPVPSLLQTFWPIENDPSYRQAIKDYRGATPEQWERAASTFEKLEARFPDSAAPTLYRGLSLQKLDRVPQANLRFEAFLRSRDAGEVLRKALAMEPRSPTLLLLEADRLIVLERFDEARTHLNLARQIEPDRLGCYVTLSKLELKLGHVPEFLASLRQGIKVGSLKLPDPVLAESVFELQSSLIFKLGKLADSEIDQGKTQADRLRSRPFLEEIDSLLGTMESRWKGGLGQGPSGQKSLSLLHHRGISASGWAVLAADQRSYSKARHLFDQAKADFSTALEMIQDSRRPSDLQAVLQRQIGRVHHRANLLLRDGG